MTKHKLTLSLAIQIPLKIFMPALFLLFSSLGFAYDPTEGNVTATLGPFFSTTQYNDSRGLNDRYTPGWGLIALGDINTRGSLEIAMIHMDKTYFREEGRYMVGEKTELMHITMGYRRWLSSYTSASLAISSSYSMGSPSTVYSDFPPGTLTVDTSARDTTEYGMEIGLQGDLLTVDKLTLILDARYNYSFTPKVHEQANHYGFLIGIRYLVQEKFPDRNPATKK